MNVDKSSTISEGRFSSEGFRIQLTDPMLYDRLHTLSAEYSLSVEMLVNVAVKRLVEDVDFVRRASSWKGGRGVAPTPRPYHQRRRRSSAAH